MQFNVFFPFIRSTVNLVQLRFASLNPLFCLKNKIHLNTNALDCADFHEIHQRFVVKASRKMQIIKLRQLIPQPLFKFPFNFHFNTCLLAFSARICLISTTFIFHYHLHNCHHRHSCNLCYSYPYRRQKSCSVFSWHGIAWYGMVWNGNAARNC